MRRFAACTLQSTRMLCWHYQNKLVLVALLALSGCALPEQSATMGLAQIDEPASESKNSGEASQPAQAAIDSKSSETPPVRSAASKPDTESDASDAVAMSDFLAQLQTTGDLDPAAQNQLLEDLRQADPKLRPLLIQKFRASLDYRQRQQAAAANAAPPQQSLPSQPLPSQPLNSQPPAAAAGIVQVSAAGSVPPAALQPVAVVAAVAAPGTKTPPGGVVPATAQAEVRPPTDWQQPLAATIRSLEEALRQAGNSSGDDRQVQLRLLYLVAGRRDDALRPLAGKEPLEQEFWAKEVYGLSTWLDASRQPDRSQRATQAAVELQQASVKLAQLGLLVVRNLAFCTEVSSYGVYKRFDKAEFQPGEKVVLYAEVENFLSEATPQGYHTALKSSYQIFDTRGQKVDENEFPLMQEHCQNPRRDFFIAFDNLRLPQPMYDGQYTLKLSIEDTLGKKIGQSTIDFTVKTAK